MCLRSFELHMSGWDAQKVQLFHEELRAGRSVCPMVGRKDGQEKEQFPPAFWKF